MRRFGSPSKGAGAQAPWELPVPATREFGHWCAWTCDLRRGGILRIVIDGGTGDVLRVAGPMPR